MFTQFIHPHPFFYRNGIFRYDPTTYVGKSNTIFGA